MGEDDLVPTIAVVGPGAIGGAVAAHLSVTYGPAVGIAARTGFHDLEVETRDGLLRTTPKVMTDLRDATRADWVLIATKTYDSASTAPWIQALADRDTRIAVMQNGVEHIERFERYVPREQLLPVVVDLPAEHRGPGRIVQRGKALLTVPATPDGTSFAELFSGTPITVQVAEDFCTAAWTKLAFNVTGAISAATLAPRLDVAYEPTERLVRQVIGEAAAVGVAEGARLPATLADEIVAALSASTSEHPNSMHADRLARRPMEIDARNGAVVRLGRRRGLATPANAMLVDLLSAVERNYLA